MLWFLIISLIFGLIIHEQRIRDLEDHDDED